MVKPTMKESKEINRLINRHKARLLCNLEDAGCPAVFRDAVSNELDWLRSDITETLEGDEGDGNKYQD